jgi:hypothetical protein
MSTLQPARQLLPGLLAMSCALPRVRRRRRLHRGRQGHPQPAQLLHQPQLRRPGPPQGKAEEWTQSFILDARSGFTQGTVGFGVDVLGLYSVKLDGGKGTTGTHLLPVHDDGRPADDFGRLGWR